MQNRLAHVVAAVDHAVTVDGMNHLRGTQALEPIGPAHQQRLHFPGFRTEKQRLRLTRGAAGGLHHNNGPILRGPFLPAMVVAEGRTGGDAGHEIVLGKYGQPGQVIQASDIAGRGTRLAPQALIEGDFPGPRNAPLELGLLARPNLVPGQDGEAFGKTPAQRIIRQHLGIVKRVEIKGIVAHISSSSDSEVL